MPNSIFEVSKMPKDYFFACKTITFRYTISNKYYFYYFIK